MDLRSGHIHAILCGSSLSKLGNGVKTAGEDAAQAMTTVHGKSHFLRRSGCKTYGGSSTRSHRLEQIQSKKTDEYETAL
jgi:hypothetical protein